MKKMVMAIIPDDEAEYVLNALILAGFATTFTETRGGMLRRAQVSLFSAVDEERLDQMLEIIKDNCRVEIKTRQSTVQEKSRQGNLPGTAELGGAIVFVWDIDRMMLF